MERLNGILSRITLNNWMEKYFRKFQYETLVIIQLFSNKSVYLLPQTKLAKMNLDTFNTVYSVNFVHN